MAHILSTYANSLRADVQARYIDKIKCIGFLDPYLLKLKESVIPDNVHTGRVVQYFANFRSPYTGLPDSNTRSAEAYHKFLDGFVSSASGKRINQHYVVKGKVAHSMKMEQAYLTPWVIIQDDGVISSAHCTCVAGLSETCSHVTTLLYALANRHYLRHVQKITVTDMPAYWLRPGKKIREDLYSAVEAIDYGFSVNKFCEEYGPRKSYDEYHKMLEDLNDSGSHAAVIRHVCGVGELTCASCAAEEIPSWILTNPNILLQKHWRKSYENESIEFLRTIASTMSFVITPEEIAAVEEFTREQAGSKLWFWARTGRITASIMKKCVSTSCDEPPAKRSLLRTISFPQDNRFDTPAMKYGREQEGNAKKSLPEIFKGHLNLQVTMKTGLHISQEQPFIAASPDALVRCDCCGLCVVEVKCPFRLTKNCHLGETFTIDRLAQSKNPFITASNGIYAMVESHDYYYQIQTQIFVVGADYGLFMIWSKSERLTIKVGKDFYLWNECLMKSKLFFERIIMPELFCNYYLKDELNWH